MNRAEKGMAAYLGEDRLRFLQKFTIGIAGAGGLGSNCAMHLVRCGFRRLVLTDFDRIEESNLNRQNFRLSQLGELKVEALAANLRTINPDLELEVHRKKVTPDNMKDLFEDCQAVVEAFDDARIKKILVESFLTSSRLVVTASGIGGFGNADAILTRKIRDNFYMIGDMQTECSKETPPFAPMVAVAAAKQADVVLSYFLDKYREGDAK